METLSRKCINAIKARALERKGVAFNLTKAVSDAGITVANPYCYSKDAMDELVAEGYIVKKAKRGWYIAPGIKINKEFENAVSVMERKPEEIFENMFKDMKEELEPVNSFDDFPIEKKPKNEAKEIKAFDTLELNQKKVSEAKAGLNFIETEFASIGRLVGLLSIFEKWCVPDGHKITASLKLKVHGGIDK